MDGTMTRFSHTAGVMALALVAVACSSDGVDGGTSSTNAEATSASTVTAAATSASTVSAAATTESTTSPDQSTVSTRSAADVAAIEAARDSLPLQVAQVTAPWPTNWATTTIDLAELQVGIGRIDPRDAIPPIDAPVFESIEAAATWLEPREPGALVVVDGEARFYPLAILHRHEIVNDTIAGIPVAVTYCPLCNIAIAFDRRLDGAVLRMGVSGLLRNSDLVMWDDQSVSLWQQATGEAIVGDAGGRRLTPISTAIVSFEDFADSFPDGMSLSQDTGFGIPYGANPYVGYSNLQNPYSFFTGDIDPRFPALERVVGVTLADGAKAFPFSLISDVGTVNDVVGGVPIVVFWGGNTLDALDTDQVATGRVIGTGLAYLATVGQQTLTFTKEGDTWIDAETGTTWSLLGEAIDGPLAGERLELAIHRNEFWFVWGAFFPDGAVYEG